MKGKFGKNYDPNIASRLGKKSTNERKEFKISQTTEAYLKGKFGADYDPAKVGQKGETVAKPFKAPSTKGYQGKNYDPDYAKKKYGHNYDPDYLKKKLGDKYDPSRAPKS